MDDLLLRLAVERGIIDLTTIRTEVSEMKRKEALAEHERKIWKGKDGRYRTYVDLPNGERRLIVKTKLKDLEEYIVGFQKQKNIRPLSYYIELWISEKEERREHQPNTVSRNRRRLALRMTGHEIDQRDISELSEQDIENYLRNDVLEKPRSKTEVSHLITMIVGGLNVARKLGVTTINGNDFAKNLFLSPRLFKPNVKFDEDEVFTDEEIKKLIAEIHARPSLTRLAIELDFYVGLRIGEMVALKWSDIRDNTLTVQRTEIHLQGKSSVTYAINERTKGKDGIRRVILTDEALKVLERIREKSESDGFIFYRNYTRLNSFALERCLITLCKSVGIKPRSFHKIRKTYATQMIKSGISTRIIQRQLGHTDISTTLKYYYFESLTAEEIKHQLSEMKSVINN